VEGLNWVQLLHICPHNIQIYLVFEDRKLPEFKVDAALYQFIYLLFYRPNIFIPKQLISM